jgi:outer membrane scaffolding protein for murein synthesis (MipA/OmpV family)
LLLSLALPAQSHEADAPGSDSSSPARTEVAEASGAQPLWELGLGALGLSQQAYPGADQQLSRRLIFPYFIYRGRWLHADRDGVGVRAQLGPQTELDVGFAGTLGAASKDVRARQGMSDLGTLVEMGPRLRHFLHGHRTSSPWKAELALRGVFDLNDGLAGKGWVVEPRLEHDWQQQAWRWSASASALLGDVRLNRHFYEVSVEDATAERPAYSARGGWMAWRLSASVWRPVGADWRLFVYARADSVNGAANADSPLVRQRVGGSAGLGLLYTGWRSTTLVSP